jgi:signal transduction histidine kinase
MNHPKSHPEPAADEPAARPSGAQDLRPVDSRRWPVTDPRREAAWSELLDLATAREVQDGVEALTRRTVDRLARLLPGHGVAARIARRAPGDWFVHVAAPPSIGADPSPDGSRWFRGVAHERREILEAGLGSVLFVASPAPGIMESGSLEAAVVARAAALFATCLDHARDHETAVHSRREVEALRGRIIQGEKLASLGQVVANVVHELSNPLTFIRAYADFLRTQAEAAGRDQPEVERLRRIGEAADRALDFAHDLTDYARPASEHPAAVCLTGVVDNALSFCEHELSSRGIRARHQLGDPAPWVLGVAGHLVQVFINLFTNAAHAMSAGGEIDVTARTDDGLVSIEVSDTGIGVDPDHLAHIFEPYFTTRDRERGTGLGLAIVADIVTAHGGRITVRSTPGSGTTFSLTLRAAHGG